MNAKELFHRVFDRYVTINLAAMAVTVVVLCVGVSYGLSLYTHHGEEIVMPDLIGTDYEDAAIDLERLGLNVVISDSGYNKKMAANAVLLQTPGSGSKVKQGHIVYVTINSPSSPTFAIPDIIDNSSFREAEARLTAMGFLLTAPQRVEGEKDWVYGILCRGRHIANGDRVSIDHKLTLQVGQGATDEQDDMELAESEDVQSEVDEFEEVKEP